MRLRIAVAVTDDAIARTPEVVHACQALGFEADSTLPWVGMFTGYIEVERIAALKMIPGVAAVELKHETRIESRRPH